MEIFVKKYNENIFKIFKILHSHLGSPNNNIDSPYYYASQLINKWLYIKKFGIIVMKKGDFAILTNLGKEFQIFLQNLKMIEIYDENKSTKKIWTCSSGFSSYYFENIKQRVCIKEDKKYKSIDKSTYTFYSNKYYIIPYKNDLVSANLAFKRNFIFSLKNLDEEMQKVFPDLPKSFKIKKELDFELKLENKNSTFFHNRKTGLTYKLLQYLVFKRIEYNIRILYINTNYLVNNRRKSEIKEYLLYFIQMLFFNNEYKEMKQFQNELIKNFPEDNIINDSLQKVIDYFMNNKNNNINTIYFIFDNIHSFENYQTINDIKTHIIEAIKLNNEKKKGNKLSPFIAEFNTNKNIFFFDFISLNNFTFCLLREFIEKKIKFIFINLKNINKIKPTENLDEYIEYCKSKMTYDLDYKSNKTEELQYLCSGNYVDNYSKLIRIMYCINSESLENITQNNIINDIKEFIEYFYLNIKENKIIKMSFRNVVLKNIFENIFILNESIIKNQNSLSYINRLTKVEEGIYLEKQIIYSFLMNKFFKSYNKIEINAIYCIGKIPKINLTNNLLFFQKNQYGPIYDFGLLIKKDNQWILKIYQISINKNDKELKKLNFNKIEFDLFYFVEKLIKIII